MRYAHLGRRGRALGFLTSHGSLPGGGNIPASAGRVWRVMAKDAVREVGWE